MTCAAFAASGSNTVMDLTGRRIENVEKKLQASSFTKWIGAVVVSVFEPLAVRWLEARAVKWTDDAIWFKGVSAEAWDENLDVRGRIDGLTVRLDKLKGLLRSVRADMVELQQHPNNTPAIKAATGHAIFGLVDLFDAIEAFKWTLMELEANYSPVSEGWAANTPEGVADLFKRIQQEA